MPRTSRDARLDYQRRSPRDDEDVLTRAQANKLVQMAAQGTSGGFTDAEGEAFLAWARKILTKAAILECILAGEIWPDIHGMINDESPVMLYNSPQFNKPRKEETEEDNGRPIEST